MTDRRGQTGSIVRMALLGVVVATAAAACGGGSGGPGDGGAGSGGGSGGASGGSGGGPGPRPSGDRRGEIRALEGRVYFEDTSTPRSVVDGRFLDGGEPSWHQVAMTDGACVLKTFTPQSCDPFCDGICYGPNQCAPWPTYVSAGTLTITGLKTPVSIPYAQDSWYYYPNVPPADLFDAGARIIATGTGGALPAFNVEARGVDPLVAEIQGGKITLLPGRAHVVRWTPSGREARVRLTINSPNQSHGNPFLAIVECDVPDSTGEITVPAAMVDALPELTAFGICVLRDCPASTLLRYTNGYAPVPGGYVEMVVGDQMSIGVEHQP